ncbi:MAG: methylated-DNA--[protein]-cysteine S-methyltransferase [Planctomycetota bacterium]
MIRSASAATAAEHRATRRTPLGTVTLTVAGGRLARVELGDVDEAVDSSTGRSDAMEIAQEALDRYLAGAGAEVPRELLDLSGTTDFQRRVFDALLGVRWGVLVTYGELAGRIGRAGAARAVGGAVGSNPLPLFVPCHRVVAAGRRLGGFGAGLDWKRRLLRHEGWTIEEDRIL